MSEFADKYPRNEENWILFPTYDVTWRKQLFSQEVFNHPAKANLYLIESLVEYLTEPGDTILDPFAGTGSLLISTLMGRNVTTIELEPVYQLLMQEAYSGWRKDLSGEIGNYTPLVGDCRLILPTFCDHVIFSPPYSTALGRGTGFKNIGDSCANEALYTYSSHSLNLGRLSSFLYSQAMRTVYKGLHDSLPPNGSMAVITKDITRGPNRVFLSEGCIHMASEEGFKMVEWHKWRPSGSAQLKIMKSKGAYVVEDEDIIIFKKEQ